MASTATSASAATGAFASARATQGLPDPSPDRTAMPPWRLARQPERLAPVPRMTVVPEPQPQRRQYSITTTLVHEVQADGSMRVERSITRVGSLDLSAAPVTPPRWRP